jgi:hypothetical protein
LITALWAAILGAAVLWPARLAGPLDGVPLDAPLEAVLIGLALPALVSSRWSILRNRTFQVVVGVLLLWKAATTVVLAQDGWCLRFTSPVPLFVNQERVPHSWDARADWRSDVPRCSAVMTHGYDGLERFPVWFYNLPPNNFNHPAQPADRPPNVTLRLDLDGYLENSQPGLFSIATDEDVHVTVDVDGADVTDAIAAGIRLAPGRHRVAIAGELVKNRWRLVPLWNGENLWSATVATMAPPSVLDRWLRPWGRYLTVVLVLALVGLAAWSVATSVNSVLLLGVSLSLSAAAAVVAWTGRVPLMRAVPLLLAAAVFLRWPRRSQNLAGFFLAIGVPFLVVFAVRGIPEAGLVTLYSSGDDWWMFQRFAYRIFMEGYWLEGGQTTFWFQPLYRWIAGALHMLFGDSSVGELFWDAGCVLVSACFAFHVTKVVAGFRWGVVAGSVVLAVLTLGPPWYLLGRGLSEISSMGFVYAGALFAMRGRHGSWPHILMAGAMALLAFFTRLNNLPMALAVALFAWPPRQPVADLFRPRRLFARVSLPTLAGVASVMALGLALFAARTWYYTGELNILAGTQAGALRAWQTTTEGLTPVENVVGSILMVLTMNDPPRLDVRALPLVVGVVSVLFAVAGVRPFNRLPFALVGLCLAGMSGAFVARGSAYPGRFSVHLIPAAVALAACACALVISRRAPRSLQPAPRSPGTT